MSTFDLSMVIIKLSSKMFCLCTIEPSEECLKGPLSTDVRGPDATDSREEEIAIDPERLQSRSDDEDT